MKRRLLNLLTTLSLLLCVGVVVVFLRARSYWAGAPRGFWQSPRTLANTALEYREYELSKRIRSRLFFETVLLLDQQRAKATEAEVLDLLGAPDFEQLVPEERSKVLVYSYRNEDEPNGVWDWVAMVQITGGKLVVCAFNDRKSSGVVPPPTATAPGHADAPLR
jgi:hypothetical protein